MLFGSHSWLRFISKCKARPSGCIVWTGQTNDDGYARFYDGGKDWYAHRWIWTVERGEIPEGMEVDHLCRNRRCVNLKHLEVVPARENQARKYIRAREARRYDAAR